MRRKWMFGAALSAMLAAVIVVPVAAHQGKSQTKSPLICAWNAVVTGSAPFKSGTTTIATVYSSVEQEDTRCSSGQVRAHAWTDASSAPQCFSIKIEDWLYVNGVQAQYNYTPLSGGTILAGPSGMGCSSVVNVYTNPSLAAHGASVHGTNKTTNLSSGTSQSANSPAYIVP